MKPGPRSRRPRIRIALLVALGALALARPASAGCHVVDPPRLLGALLDAIEGTAERAPDGRAGFERRPCRGDAPGPSTAPAVPFDSPLNISAVDAPPAASGRVMPLPDATKPGPVPPGRVDRPPRTA